MRRLGAALVGTWLFCVGMMGLAMLLAVAVVAIASLF
jgi:hypothetical protein